MSIFEWLLLPIDSSRPHVISDLISWHARLMVVAWGVFVPLAIIVARYFKIRPKQKWPNELDSKFWWHSHLFLQISAMLLATISLVLIFIHSGGGNDLHRYLGWFVTIFMVSQAISGSMRGSKGGPTEANIRGDHYDMTYHRYFFEYIHKITGYLALLLSMITIITGLWQTNAPRWMWVIIFAWWSLLLILSIYLQTQKKCIDTYQAIWGPLDKHPGNHKPIVGFGINRLSKAKKDTNKKPHSKKSSDKH